DTEPQNEIQLGSVMLHVAHVIQDQLLEAKFAPRKLADMPCLLIGQVVNRRLALLTTVEQVVLKLLLCVWPCRKKAGWIEFVQREGRRRGKAFLAGRQTEISPKQCMKCEIPEADDVVVGPLWPACWITPQLGRASVHGVL